MALPAAPTDPGSAFGAGDPRNALYFQHLAALDHQYNTKLAGSAEARAHARAKAAFQQGVLDRQEPVGLENTRNRANSEGLLHSGVLAGRAGALQAQYVQKGGQITSGLQETEGRIGGGEQSAKEAWESGRAEAATKALGEGYEWLRQNPVSPAEETNPGGVRTVTGPAGPGGVTPYSEKTPGGSVRVGAGYASPATRAAAANGNVPAKVSYQPAGTVTIGGRPGPSTAGIRRSAGERYLAKARAKARL